MKTFVYQIRRKVDGLFSTGGVRPSFATKGKEWKLGALKNHFSLTKQRHWTTDPVGGHPLPYNDAEHEVVKIEVLKMQVEVSPISEVVREMGKAAAKRALT